MDLHVKDQSTKDRYRQVEEQFQSWNMFGPPDSGHGKTRGISFITISRQYGCAGFRIGDKLAEILNTDENPIPWAVYDKKLVDMVCENPQLEPNSCHFSRSPEGKSDRRVYQGDIHRRTIIAENFQKNRIGNLLAGSTRQGDSNRPGGRDSNIQPLPWPSRANSRSARLASDAGS